MVDKFPAVDRHEPTKVLRLQFGVQCNVRLHLTVDCLFCGSIRRRQPTLTFLNRKRRRYPVSQHICDSLFCVSASLRARRYVASLSLSVIVIVIGASSHHSWLEYIVPLR